MKKQLFVIFSAILFLSSCSWFNNDPIQPIPVIPQFNTFTISGKLGTNGAMPENFARALNSRTALATAPGGQTIQYKVLLLANEGDATPITGATSNVTEDPITHELSYTIKYTGTDTTAVRYWLRAVTYYMNGTDEVVILSSPDTQLETAVDLKGGVFTKDLEMRPATTGVGKVALTITLEDASMCDTVSIDDDTHFNITKSGTTVTITHVNIAADNPNVACGSYPVTVSFYKNQTINSTSTPVLVYQFEDVINVFNNLTTNTWVDNGNSPHLTTASGVTTCSITTAKLAAFNATNFYVDKNFTGTEKGTFAEPFKSLQYAIQYINAIGNTTSYYTIHIKGNGETFTSGLAITKTIILEPYATVPGAKDGIFQITCSGTVFTINSAGVLSFKSNRTALGTGYPTGATKGIVISGATIGVQITNGKFEMEGGYISGSTSGVWISAPAVGTNCIFEMSGGYINGTTGDSSGGGVRVLTGAVFRVRGKPVISGGTKGVYLVAGQTIKVVGPLASGALIGVTTSTPPTATENVTITSGYGYQTGGYNAGVLPGTYFRGDVYGVTQDGDPTSGEAVLKLSGGNISTKVRDDITIDIDHTNASNNAADRKFTFTVTKDKGAVAPATSTDLTSAEGISYSYKLKNYADVISNSPTAYYNTSANTLTFNTNLPQGKYKLEVEVTWDGNKYQAAFDVGYVKTDVPSGCVAVLGSTWNSSTTLCAGDTNRQSKLFIANRHLDIPDIIASDHEVTQTEWEQYMTYDPANTNVVAESGADKDVYPVYYIDWYGMIVYCNLRTLGDSTFGSTRAERLTHCAYSLNGSKDPESWLNSVISGTRIYKIGEKYYYKCYKNEGSDDDENEVLSPKSSGSGIQLDLNADGWRLPTAVEWEYLARDGNLIPETQTIYAGSNSADEVYNNERPHEIRTLKPNALKIYDLSGNVEEWLWDRTNDSPEIQTTTPITGKSYAGSDNGKKRCIGRPGDPINLYIPSYVNRGYKWTQGFRVIRTVR
ncbi:MAG: formylglycine-generating enzyme family protein [Treponema sp.]|nr:formylglycine-generating enzyme family protein [Treponema sp.]